MGSVPNSFLHGESFLDSELFWGNQKSDSANPYLFNPYIDNEYNNNSMKFKSQIWNFPLISDAINYQDEEEKENLSWLPDAIQSVTVSLNNNINSTILFGEKKCLPNGKKQDPKENIGNDGSIEPAVSIDDQIKRRSEGEEQMALGTEADNSSVAMGPQEVPQVSTIVESQVGPMEPVSTKCDDILEVIVDSPGASKYESAGRRLVSETSHAGTEELSYCPHLELQPDDEMDTLLTFLSKFDDKVAAIWGSKIQRDQLEPSDRGNTWNSCTALPAELFTYHAIEEDLQFGSGCESMGINLTEKFDAVPQKIDAAHKAYQLAFCTPDLVADRVIQEKHNIMNSMQRYFGSIPSEKEYCIIKNRTDNTSSSGLDILNHSDETSGFIKFIPLRLLEGGDEKYYSATNSNGDLNSASNIKEMLNNLDLDCDEEQEIIAACSKANTTLTDATAEDLLTSWKTHFRTVIAQEIRSNDYHDAGGISPGISQNRPILPEFRTDYDGTDYVLFQRGPSSAFQVRFKVCRENEKGNQTDDFGPFLSSFGVDYSQIPRSFSCTAFQRQYPDWYSEFDDEYTTTLEAEWPETQFLDPCAESFYDDSAFDEYDGCKLGHDELDLNSLNSLGWNENIPYVTNNKQKSNRRRAKARPCKYFFMDGSCRRGNDCKFSHDLITCRFWAEGSCLKGQACPFLHCFIDEKDYDHDGVTDSKIGIKYQLESESDFPALGSTKISSRVPMEEANKVIGILTPEDTQLNKFIDQFDEQEANGWSHQQEPSSTNNWICSLISVNEKRKKKKH